MCMEYLKIYVPSKFAGILRVLGVYEQRTFGKRRDAIEAHPIAKDNVA
jgi:hypothetical protein